jgi:flagellar hook-length control protein FliK
LSNVALDTIPQWSQRPEPGSSRAGSSSADTSPNRFDALLDDTSSDARPAPSEQYDRSRAPDRRDDTRAADDRAAAQSRAGDARAAERQKAADERTAQAADDAKAQHDSDKAAAAKDQPGTGASDPTQTKTKPAATPADAAQAQGKSQGKPVAKPSDAIQATATETPAEPVDAAAAEAQAKAVAAKAAAAIGGTVTTDKKTDKTAKTDKDATAAATTAPDPNAAPVQVPVLAVPVAPLPTIDPSVGAASTANATPNSPTIDAASIAGAAPQAVDAEAAKQAAAAASAESADAKAAGIAEQASFKALAEAAEAKPQAGVDVKVELAGKPKAAQPTSANAKTAAAADQAKSSAANVAQTVDIAADTQIVPVPRTPHLIPISAEHTTTLTYPGASEGRADAVTATAAAAQTGNNAPILPLNLAQPIALPLSTMFQVAAPKPDAAADAAVPVAGLAVEIVSRAQEGGKRFDIRLDPPELGRVDVRLNVDDAGKVTSHLVVERSETLDLLRRDQPQLERALQQAGLNTDGGLQFSLRDQNSAQRDQTPRDSSTNTSQLIVPDDEAAAAEAARRGYGRLLGRAGGVDIRI